MNKHVNMAGSDPSQQKLMFSESKNWLVENDELP